MGVSECYFGPCGSAGVEVGEVVGSVLETFFGQAEYVFGQREPDVGACVDAEGVIAAHAAESESEDCLAEVDAEAVFVFESVEDFVRAHAGVEERGGLAVDVVEDVADADGAVGGEVEVAESGHGHESVSFVAESGVGLEAVEIVVVKVARLEILGRGAYGKHGDNRCHTTCGERFYVVYHRCSY